MEKNLHNSLSNLINELSALRDEVARLELENKMLLGNHQLVEFDKLPELIKRKRIADSLSFDEFALQLDMNSKTLRKLENSRYIQNVSMKSLLTVCDHLGIQLMAKG